MNSVAGLGQSDHASASDVKQSSSGDIDFIVSKQLNCSYKSSTRVLWSTWNPPGIPSFNWELLRDLERASQLIESRFGAGSPKTQLDYIVLRSGKSGAFNVGGDLGYLQRLITTQDRARLSEYAQAAINVIYRNFMAHNLSGVTTVALLEGDALGGGLECALSCDVVIAERQVRAGFPEVLFNMFPGMGGLSLLARRVGHRIANEMVRTGRLYSAAELLEYGVVDKVVESGSAITAFGQLASSRHHQKLAHCSMNAADRVIRPLSLQELYDVVKIWVDSALGLDSRSLQWMQRLYQRQISIFEPNEVSSVPNYVRSSAAAA